MFFVPGIIISILTFPGVIVHELAHQLFCRLYRVAIFDVVYFQTKNPVGYVIHEHAMYNYQSILICVGPFFINTILGFIIAFPAALQMAKFNEAMGPVQYILIYFGVSIAMHAFPSIGDAKAIWQGITKDNNDNRVQKIVVMPIMGLIYLGAWGSAFWLDFFYGVAVAIWIPNALVKWIA